MSDKHLPTTQHAVQIREFGEPEVMTYQDGVAIPELTDNQVLIKIAYAGINPVDYKTRQGKGWGAEAIQKDKFDNNIPIKKLKNIQPNKTELIFSSFNKTL